MIYMLAAKGYLSFVVSSNRSYQADANGIILVRNDSLTDVTDLIAAGCQTLSAYAVASTPNLATGGNVDAVAPGTIPAATYNNGVAGVGATLTGNANGAFPSQDGVAMTVGKRVLLRSLPATMYWNGIYVVTQLGDGSNPFILTRATGCDQPSEVANHFVMAAGGALYANVWFFCPVGANVVIGTTPLPYLRAT